MLRALVVAFVCVALATTAAGVASAEGGSPSVFSPDLSSPQYQGFHGPFGVEFVNAATGSYACHVEVGGVLVVSCADEYAWDGTGSSEHLFTVPALAPSEDYVFVVHEASNATPDVRVPFTVRAGAQPTCTVLLPSVVRVGRDQTPVGARLAPDCAAASVQQPSWDVYRVAGPFVESLQFDGTTRDSFSFFARRYATGTYFARPTDSAHNAGSDSIRQNTPRVDVRLDSRLVLRTHRDGRKVTLTSTLTRYFPHRRTFGAFGAWTKRPITFSFRTCGTCAWHRLAVRRTDRHGDVVVRLRTAKVRGYRVTAGGTTVVWAPHPRYGRR
ncbi:MAG: hypothetical protein ACJ72E_13450 [Marmoricola sp.]